MNLTNTEVPIPLLNLIYDDGSNITSSIIVDKGLPTEGSFGSNLSVLNCVATEFKTPFIINEPYPDRKEIWTTIHAEEIVKIIAYILLFIISVAGNCLVILIVFCNYGNKMRKATRQYLVNLAFADLLVTLFSIWSHPVRHLSFPQYIFPAFFCKIDSFMSVCTLTASVLTLTAISVDRFVAVRFPFRAKTSRNRAKWIIGFIWTVSLAISLPIFVYRKKYGIEWKDITIWHCDEIWPVVMMNHLENGCVPAFDMKRRFYIILTITLYFIPMSIMLISYSSLVWRLRSAKLPEDLDQHYKGRGTNQRVEKTLCIVFLAFFICWTPLQTIILYKNLVSSSPPIDSTDSWFSHLEYSAYFLAHTNSALNPILYCSFNKSFKEGLKALMRCQKRGYDQKEYSKEQNWRRLTARTKETTLAGSILPDAELLQDMSNRRQRIVRANMNHTEDTTDTSSPGTPQCYQLKVKANPNEFNSSREDTIMMTNYSSTIPVTGQSSARLDSIIALNPPRKSLYDYFHMSRNNKHKTNCNKDIFYQEPSNSLLHEEHML